MSLRLTQPRRIHLIGAGGAGMGAIASVLASMGHQVTGSDLKHGPVVERLRAEGIKVAIGHSKENIGDAEIVAISSAIGPHNSELKAAHALGLEVVTRREMLPAIASQKQTVAVAGTHGKTTVCSMLAMILQEAGLEPSFIIGGDINEVGSGAAWGAGNEIVVEADESDRSFLALQPDLAVVTNVEPDHLETYGGNAEELAAAFAEFAKGAAALVYCQDDLGAAALGGRANTFSYGTSADADYQLTDVSGKRSSISFCIRRNDKLFVDVCLPTPGLHNALNATAAAVAGDQLGASATSIGQALSHFGGVARRFEFRGTAEGITFIDDYAHLPNEIRAAIATARQGEWNRLVVVFQPHRFSRTATLYQDFAGAFDGADEIVVTSIYSAGEMPRPGVTGRSIAEVVAEDAPQASLRYIPRLVDVEDHLISHLQAGDLCLTLGAGDLTNLPDGVLARLRQGQLG